VTASSVSGSLAVPAAAAAARGQTDATDRSRVGRPAGRGRGWWWVRVVVAVVIAVVMLFPFYWMLQTAFSTRDSLYAPGLHLIPTQLTLENFTVPFERYPVGRWFRNSLLIAVVTTAITLVVNLFAGYAFAKFRFPGRNVLFLVLLSTMMIPVQAIMVPQFRLVADLGLYGNVWAVILPTSASAFGIFLARQFFLAIPEELLEAARIDGAGRWRTFVSVVLPLSKPLLATLTLLSFMNVWNDFAWPLIVFFGNEQAFTLPIGLVTDFRGQYSADYGKIMALSLVMVAPMLVLFLAFQRYFVQGLARSGLR
jgi:ABC-type glycerol-3-phosphate transport system permease component